MSSAITHDLEIRPRRGDDVAEGGFSVPVRSPYRCDGEAEAAADDADGSRAGGEESVSRRKGQGHYRLFLSDL